MADFLAGRVGALCQTWMVDRFQKTALCARILRSVTDSCCKRFRYGTKTGQQNTAAE